MLIIFITYVHLRGGKKKPETDARHALNQLYIQSIYKYYRVHSQYIK